MQPQGRFPEGNLYLPAPARRSKQLYFVGVCTCVGCVLSCCLAIAFPTKNLIEAICIPPSYPLYPQVQRDILAQFSRGALNVLVCTNVGAEGMDFRQCGLVMAADPPSSVISYIQCRGRARKAGSRYLLMAPDAGDGCQAIGRLARWVGGVWVWVFGRGAGLLVGARMASHMACWLLATLLHHPSSAKRLPTP